MNVDETNLGYHKFLAGTIAMLIWLGIGAYLLLRN